MKKVTTKLLYVFSFSLLFVALYLNFFSHEEANTAFLKTENNAAMSNSVLSENGAVAQPENHTAQR